MKFKLEKMEKLFDWPPSQIINSTFYEKPTSNTRNDGLCKKMTWTGDRQRNKVYRYIAVRNLHLPRRWQQFGFRLRRNLTRPRSVHVVKQR